jgi:hypothetical protein
MRFTTASPEAVRTAALGLNLISEQTDKGRVYRIRDGKAAAVDRVKQAA